MRIAIVNDLAFSVEALRRVVTSVPEYTVAWTAADGQIAIEKAVADKPDLILMDLIMPVMDGAESTRHIMHRSPCAILVVTATVEGNSGLVFDAMGFGALDAVDTPRLGPRGDMQGADRLLEKIAIVARLIGHSSTMASTITTRIPLLPPRPVPPMVVIGASTGGPAALVTLLAALPKPIPAAVVIVQHVDALFAPGLAAWLGTQTGQAVRTIEAGHKPEAGEILLATTNDHLRLNASRELTYSVDPAESSFRPSVDVFMRDAVHHWLGPLVGVLLTGMGADGAQGLLAMRRAGWPTIAQDEATSIVYGMPKAAAKLNAASEILPIDGIAASVAYALDRHIAQQNASSAYLNQQSTGLTQRFNFPVSGEKK